MNLVLLAPTALRAQTQPSPTNGTIDAVMPAYNPFRYEGDWSFLKDRPNSGDWLDHLKYARVSDNSGKQPSSFRRKWMTRRVGILRVQLRPGQACAARIWRHKPDSRARGPLLLC